MGTHFVSLLAFLPSPLFYNLYKKLTLTRLELGVRRIFISIYVPYNREVTVLRSDLGLKISSNTPKKSRKRSFPDAEEW